MTDADGEMAFCLELTSTVRALYHRSPTGTARKPSSIMAGPPETQRENRADDWVAPRPRALARSETPTTTPRLSRPRTALDASRFRARSSLLLPDAAARSSRSIPRLQARRLHLALLSDLSAAAATSMGSLTPPKPIALRLPAELWDVILLEHTPREHVQRTALSLLIVFPTAPVSHLSLWRHLVVARPEQLLPLYQLVRPLEARESEECRAVRSFEMRSWRGDPDILNNTLGVLSGVRELHLRVGTNWAPEHLEDSLAKRRPKLEQLSIQWRPYVEKPSYYIFLSGNYCACCLYHRCPLCALKLTGYPALGLARRRQQLGSSIRLGRV